MTDPAALSVLLWWLLGAVVFPLWLLSGLGDYLFHARTDIAHTSGTHESALHLLQTAEIGIPVLAFLFFPVNAAVLVVMVAGVAAHSFTSWRDLRYAAQLRYIPPGEQYVHAFLNVLPWVALALVMVLHWPAVTSLFDPSVASDWALRPRRPGFDGAIVFAVLASSALLGVLPGLLEFVRTLSARRTMDPVDRVHVDGAQVSSSNARSATKPR
jgi:hypothetical protein